jgi:hypothetical protein
LSSRKVQNPRTFSEILDKLKNVMGVSTEAAVANELQITPQGLSDFKRRGRIPYERLVKYCLKNSISLDWLFTENFSPATRVEFSGVGESQAAYGNRTDACLAEIVSILERDLPSAKKHIHRILVLRKDLKQALEEFYGAEDLSSEESAGATSPKHEPENEQKGDRKS